MALVEKWGCMTRDQVIEWARAAGFQTGSINQADGSFGYHLVAPIGGGCIVELERFAALVAAAEREACAELMEQQHAWVSNVAASALIRARGQGGVA